MLQTTCLSRWLVGLGVVLAMGNTSVAQTKEDATVAQANDVFREIMEIPANGIPMSMLKDAHGVAIIPRVIKGSFIVGARHGNGVVLVRDVDGSWHAPVFITLTGGNIGWQVGVQSTDVVLVFRTPQSVNGILNGKFTLGADAAVAAGPVGRQAAAGTDASLTAEILSYSRSRGLFAGVSFDGSVIQVDSLANSSYYGPSELGAPTRVPPAAQQLIKSVSQFTSGNPTASPANELGADQAALARKYSTDGATLVRDQLSTVSPQLYRLLDPNWQNYLAIPAEVFQENGHPNPQAIKECLARFEAIRVDGKYAQLADLPEFQSTYGLLKQYAQAIDQSNRAINLPLPPSDGLPNP